MKIEDIYFPKKQEHNSPVESNTDHFRNMIERLNIQKNNIIQGKNISQADNVEELYLDAFKKLREAHLLIKEAINL